MHNGVCLTNTGLLLELPRNDIAHLGMYEEGG